MTLFKRIGGDFGLVLGHEHNFRHIGPGDIFLVRNNIRLYGIFLLMDKFGMRPGKQQ